uniref:Thioredoxin domain-containing protein n=1 Tax=Minutocellus polymorphus TaxID=265543 RepID=A0A7S0FJI6_9STRA
MPRPTLLTAAAVGLAATTFVASPETVSAFVPIQGVSSTRKRTLPTTSLNAVAPPPMPSPFREEKSDKDKKKKGDGDIGSDDWTETSGGGVRGFVPTFLQRTKTKNEAEAATKSKKRSPRDLITNVETLQDYKTVVADETEKITVVRFYAKWCRSCRAAEPQYHKLVRDFADHDVKFVQVPLKKENAFLHEGLGVPSVPFAHIYHPEGGLVEEMKMNKKKFTKVRTALEQYVSGSCYLEDEPEEDDIADDVDDGTPIGEFQ